MSALHSWNSLRETAKHLLRHGTRIPGGKKDPSPEDAVPGVFIRAPYHNLTLDLADRLLQLLEHYKLEDVPVDPQTGRRGDWSRMHSGTPFYYLDPKPEEVVLEDLLWGLSHVCRFGGHTARHYSVLSHSLMVARMCLEPEVRVYSEETDPVELYRAGLGHDFSESYLGDVPTPLKRFLPGYSFLEWAVNAAIDTKLGLGGRLNNLPRAVKKADRLALAVEARDLCGDPEWARVREPDLAAVVARYRVQDQTPGQVRFEAEECWKAGRPV